MKKQILSMLLVTCMVFALFPATATGAEVTAAATQDNPEGYGEPAPTLLPGEGYTRFKDEK